MNTSGLAACLLIRRVQGFSCRPGWRFEPKLCRRDGKVVVDVAVDMESAYNPGETVTVTKRLSVKYPEALIKIGAFTDWMMDQIDLIERHESREWARLDGEKLFDLHPEMSAA